MPKHRDRKKRNREAADEAELPATTGALGTEKLRKRKRERKDVGNSALDRIPLQNAPVAGNVLPAHTDAPPPPSENLAGAPELQRNNWQGAKVVKQEHVRPWVNSNVNAESSIHFQLHTGAYEWVHFDRNSISVVLYTTYKYPQHDAASADPIKQKEWHATTRGTPTFFLDPDVGARGFFGRVEVIINDQLVPTNGCLGTLFPHYSRVAALFANENPKRRKPHFKALSDWSFTQEGLAKDIMKAATDAFAQRAYNHDAGRRLFVPLDGIFPFDTKSLISQAIENQLPQHLFIGPSTKFEVKLYFMPDRLETLFHNQLTSANYFKFPDAGAADVQKGYESRLTFQSTVMEYLSVELLPVKHANLMSRFRGNHMGYWNFDIPRSQHQPLVGGVSYTENTFPIFAYCRALVVLFLADHSTFYQAHTRRPLSAWSTFPEGCTKMEVEYANTKLGGPYINFGVRGDNNELSMSQYYNYLVGLGLGDNFTFDDLFPASTTARSLIQMLVFDVRHLMLNKVQLLRLGMEFSGASTSPTKTQIAVISIHPNGRANVKNMSDVGVEWDWSFLQSN